MPRRYRRNESQPTSFSVSLASGKKKSAKPKPIPRNVIEKYLKIKALEEGAERVGNIGEAAAARSRRMSLEDAYPGLAAAAARGTSTRGTSTRGATGKTGKRAAGRKRAGPKYRTAYTAESEPEAFAKVAAEAAKKAAASRVKKVVFTMPDGSTFEAEGYATTRAANIDAKQLVRVVRKVFSARLGFDPREFPIHTRYDEDDEESGYQWGEKLRARTDAERAFGPAPKVKDDEIKKNPFRRLRHNTHLPVGTSVDYKGKKARVIAQHDRDLYTVRFPATGSEMRVPGFLLKAR